LSPTSQSRNDCPPEQAWDEVAVGLKVGREAEALLEHASSCEACAATLRDALQIFAPEREPHAETAPPLIEMPPRRAHQVSRSAWLYAAAAMLVLACGTTYIYWRYLRDASPLKQLARIYAAHRTIELRLPGAAYGPIRVERGVAPRSLTDQPEELLDVASQVRRRLARNANDPLWLWTKGRLAILESRPDEAVQALQAALDWGQSSADLLTDLAIAYWERGRRDNAAVDLNHAVELLGRALRANPNHLAALFDRALIEEELQETVPAIADLEKLLAVEPSGSWSEETRSRLAQLRAKRARFFDRSPDQDSHRFDEVALDVALQQGLMTLDTDLNALAVRIGSSHHDKWLADLLKERAAPDGAASIAVLARMASIRLTVESGRYRQEKAAFDSLSKTPQPTPIAAWYALEALYRATRARGEFRCPASSNRFLAMLEARNYYWAFAQILRMQGTCSAQSGDMDSAQRYAERSIASASQHGFPVTASRARALLVNVYRRRGQYREALNLSNSALAEIGEQQLPVSRSHEFFNIIMGTSEALGWWHSAMSSATALTEAARVAGFRDLQFTNMVRWAQLALLCGDRVQSKGLFGRALAYYATLAPSENRAWAEIGFAEASRDESRLALFAPELEASEDSISWIPYQRARSELAIQSNHLAEARGRLNRIVAWMNRPEVSLHGRSKQWYAEFQAVGQLFLRLMLSEGQAREALDFLELWRMTEGLALSQVDDPARVPANGALMFSFYPVGDRFAAWRVDGDSVDFRWVPVPRSEVERLVRCLHRLISSRQSDLREITSLGGYLSNALFGSWLESAAPNRPLVIQTDDTLNNLAFAALPGNREPLGLEHAISVTPLEISKSNAGALTHPGKIVLIDASRANPAWPDLPPIAGAEREIASVRGAGPNQVEVIQGEKVTGDSIAQLGSSAGVLHFLGHTVNTTTGVALVLPTSPTPQGLQELRTMGFRTPATVVLSACATGESMHNESFGSSSLATAFLLEGSGEVIASLWNVDSESTSALMGEYYRRLRLGIRSENALQSAMRAIRNLREYTHPYYWASFARFVRI
jgi:tetratricopeptide (TPR) repeat protein